MRIKTPSQIKQGIRKANITEIEDRISDCTALVEFEGDTIKYKIEFDTDDYSLIIEEQNLNVFQFDRELTDDTHNPVDVIQYPLEVPLLDVIKKDYILKTCIELGLRFEITAVIPAHIDRSIGTLGEVIKTIHGNLPQPNVTEELAVGALVLIDSLKEEVNHV